MVFGSLWLCHQLLKLWLFLIEHEQEKTQTCLYVIVVGGSWYWSTNATLSPNFSAEVLQMSGTAFHSSKATAPLPETNELSNKGENLLIWTFSVYIQNYIVGTLEDKINQNDNYNNIVLQNTPWSTNIRHLTHQHWQ